jgi:hypothetical protein
LAKVQLAVCEGFWLMAKFFQSTLAAGVELAET